MRIDMEGSAQRVDDTLDIFEHGVAASGMRNVGVVLQVYLYRTEQDLQRSDRSVGVRVRLCKGAHNESSGRRLSQPSLTWMRRTFA